MLYYIIELSFYKGYKVITVTDSAAAELKRLMQEDGRDLLRLAVSGGGCSGFQYIMQIEGEKTEQDKLIETNGVKIIIDPVSLSYVKGSKIDLTGNLVGGGFNVKNPNATSTCGCGMSFEK
jgi:iron-sulfur cluster insertion protein